MFWFCLNYLQGVGGELFPTSQQHRIECDWQYTYVIGFFSYWMLPEDGLSKTETYWSLQRNYMVSNFLIILKV
jgi:hypothetical protein